MILVKRIVPETTKYCEFMARSGFASPGMSPSGSWEQGQTADILVDKSWLIFSDRDLTEPET